VSKSVIVVSYQDKTIFSCILAWTKGDDDGYVVLSACLNPIEPIAAPTWAPRLRGPALELSTLGCSSTQNNTLQVLQRTPLVPHLLRLACLY